MSPLSAELARWMMTMSPSWMPASIIESPLTSSAKCSPLPSMSGGQTISCLWFWMALIGTPAAMRPIIGTATPWEAAMKAGGGVAK